MTMPNLNFYIEANMSYQIIRSKRKTISIRITQEGILEVRSPLNVSNVIIEQLVQSKQKWIWDHMITWQKYHQQKIDFCVQYTDLIFYRGKQYPIEARIGNQSGFDGVCFYLSPNLNVIQVKNEIISIYKKLAKEYLSIKVMQYANQMGVMPTAIKVNSAKTRWGSCSGKNSLNFSWFLILAQDTVIDYVVVHELAHILEHNHSGQFWKVVENILPNYKVRRQGLKILQNKLSQEDWS